MAKFVLISLYASISPAKHARIGALGRVLVEADADEVEHLRGPLVGVGEGGGRLLRDQEDGSEGVQVCVRRGGLTKGVSEGANCERRAKRDWLRILHAGVLAQGEGGRTTLVVLETLTSAISMHDTPNDHTSALPS